MREGKETTPCFSLDADLGLTLAWASEETRLQSSLLSELHHRHLSLVRLSDLITTSAATTTTCAAATTTATSCPVVAATTFAFF